VRERREESHRTPARTQATCEYTFTHAQTPPPSTPQTICQIHRTTKSCYSVSLMALGSVNTSAFSPLKHILLVGLGVCMYVCVCVCVCVCVPVCTCLFSLGTLCCCCVTLSYIAALVSFSSVAQSTCLWISLALPPSSHSVDTPGGKHALLYISERFKEFGLHTSTFPL
jgi:hypothetical protein